MESGTIKLVRGDDQTLGFTITQSDGVTPYDLTGATMVFYVRRSTYYSPLVLTVTTTVFSDPTAGVGTFTFVPADTIKAIAPDGIDALPPSEKEAKVKLINDKLEAILEQQVDVSKMLKIPFSTLNAAKNRIPPGVIADLGDYITED